MPLNGLVVKKGVTGLTPVGGADLTYTLDGTPVVGGVHISNAAQTDFRLREAFSCKYRPPKQNADKSWQKAKMTIVLGIPKIDASTGDTYFDVVRTELEFSPITPAADQDEMCYQMAQFLSSASTLAYRRVGSLS